MERQEKQPKKDDALDEGKIEKQFNSNLLTNYEKTMDFMKAIEGPGWLENQPQGVDIKNSFEHVMDWLKNPENSENHRPVVILYGWGGGDRYSISKDGSVKFIASFGTPRTLSMAKGISFPIEK
jgi:hypothetical protein